MTLNRNVYRLLAWGGIALVGAATLLQVVRGDWAGTLVLLLFFGLSVAFVLLRRRLPNLFDLLFVVAAVVNAAGYAWNLFDRVVFYDELVHLYTPFAFSLGMAFLAYRSLLVEFQRHSVVFVLAVGSFGLSVGALWELFEWYVLRMDLTIADTISDLAMDAIGSLTAGVMAAATLGRTRRRRHRTTG